MSRIFWDTMLFVYWFEDHPRYAPRVIQILARMKERNDEWFTSSLAVGEVLVGPYKLRSERVAQQMEEFFRSPSVRIVPFTAAAAIRYAKIRAHLKVSPADAVHLACAAEAGTDLFLTNDSSLLRKPIPGIQFIDDLDTRLL